MRLAPILAIVLLAGCAAPGLTTPGADGPPTSREPLFVMGDPSVIGAGSTEASLALAADGTMLACTHGEFRQPSPLYASDDHGATWRRADPPLHPFPSGDCDVSIGPDGAWYVAYDTLASATVAVSADRGRTWRTSFASALPAGGVDRPWLQATPAGVFMTYCDIMGVEPAACFFARSDDGLTWTDHRVLVAPDGSERPHAVTGRLWTSPDGRTIRLPVFAFNGNVPDPDGWLLDATSTDAGATWSTRIVAGAIKAPPQFASISVDGAGTAWYSFTRMNGSAAPIGASANVGWIEPVVADVLVASQPAGEAWGEPVLVAPAQTFATVASTWISGAAQGAVVAWDAEVGAGTWQVTAARVRDGLAPVLAPVGPATQAPSGVDFLQTWHEQGRALVVYVMPSAECAAADCILLAREVAPDG